MLKITAFLLLLTSITFAQTIDVNGFKVNEPINQNFSSGTRIDYEFKIKGDYSYGTHGYHQIDLILYKNSVSSSNEIARSYWNSEDDVDLIFSNYTKKNWWNTSIRNYSTFPGQIFKLVVKYANLTKIYTYTIPGSAGNPDLTVDLDDSIAYSSCQSCLPWFDLFLPSGKRHLVAGGVGSIRFDKLIIRNTGNSTSTSSNVEFYLSVNNTLDSNDNFIKSVSIPARNINSSYGVYTKINGWDLFSCTNCGTNNGNYYIIIKLDASNTNSEGSTGESNNILAIPITYTTNVTATSLKTKVSFTNNRINDKPYNINVFNFQGRKILSKKVYTIEDENSAVLNLSEGLYIIKSLKGDRKVYINPY